jgi:hypothetical protein
VASWIETLLQLLCAIYQEWGGDCKELFDTPAAAPGTVVGSFNHNGAPSFANPQDKATFLANLDDLETLLASSNNSLPTEDTVALTQMIADLRKILS